jgi:hypothetical protein
MAGKAKENMIFIFFIKFSFFFPFSSFLCFVFPYRAMDKVLVLVRKLSAGFDTQEKECGKQRNRIHRSGTTAEKNVYTYV